MCLIRPVSENAKNHVHLWTTCVAGGLLKDEYFEIMKKEGLSNIQITDAYDVFSKAPVASSAYKFKAKGYNIFASKIW